LADDHRVFRRPARYHLVVDLEEQGYGRRLFPREATSGLADHWRLEHRAEMRASWDQREVLASGVVLILIRIA
jgi:hypothetical protein